MSHGERADLRAWHVERRRDFGESYLALSLWHRLGLDALLATLLPAGCESVGWAHLAALLTVARFCAQRSELGVAEHVWVMDCGMVSEANIAVLRAHERTLLEQSDWKTVQDGLEVRLVEQPEGEPGERYVLCRSGARAEKERAMLQRPWCVSSRWLYGARSNSGCSQRDWAPARVSWSGKWPGSKAWT